MKNKKGKKLVVLGAMAALLTLIGVSGSQTYAKYIEEAKVTTQKATVARWGFVQSVTTDNLFANAYGAAAAELASPTDYASAVTAKAFAEGNEIVQPGGTGSLTFHVEGRAEVFAKFTFDSVLRSEIQLGDGSKTYKPIIWSYNVVNATSNSHESGDLTVTDQSWEVFSDKLADVEIGVDPDNDVNINVTISWKWLFDTDDGAGADSTEVANKIKGGVLDTNEADTLLAILSKGSGSLEYNFGDVSYNYAANSKTAMDFDITMKAEQIQEFTPAP